MSPEHSSSLHRSLNTKLRDCGFKAILLHGEQSNSKYNNCRGLWPYIAQIWESKQGQPAAEASNKADNITKLCKRLAYCFFRLNMSNVAAIASSYHNQAILKTLRTKESFMESTKAKPSEPDFATNLAFENW